MCTLKLTCAILGSMLSMVTLPQVAQAGQFYNGWNYGIDAIGDGSSADGNYFGTYDLKGLAIKETDDSIFVAINANMGIEGSYYGGAEDRNIGYGDLFFNFTGDDFQTANKNGNLLGIRFADSNDSGVSETGVYSNVTAKSVTRSNSGYRHLKQYYRAGFYKENTMGTDYATKEVAMSEFGERDSIKNVIKSGTYLGNINLISQEEMTGEGLDFDHFGANGSETIGFSFSRAFTPTAQYVASLFLECGNDGVALNGETQDVPESSMISGFALIGIMLGARRWHHKIST